MSKERVRVGYHFYKLRSWTHLFLRIFTYSSIGHIRVSVQTDAGISYYDCSWHSESGWYNSEYEFTPFDSLYEDMEIDLTTLDLLLPKGEKYNALKVGLHYYFGVPKSPSSCISAVHRIRFLCGKKTRGRSPRSVYRHLRKELRNQSRLTG